MNKLRVQPNIWTYEPPVSAPSLLTRRRLYLKWAGEYDRGMYDFGAIIYDGICYRLRTYLTRQDIIDWGDEPLVPGWGLQVMELFPEIYIMQTGEFRDPYWKIPTDREGMLLRRDILLLAYALTF